jgi:hypothetical protein
MSDACGFAIFYPQMLALYPHALSPPGMMIWHIDLVYLSGQA